MKNDEKILRILEKLEELRNRGLINEEYYQERRKVLLSKYLEGREETFYPKPSKLSRYKYIKIGILVACIIFIIVFTSSIVISYTNASSVNILATKLVKVSQDSISVKILFNNPSTHQNYIARCSYEIKLSGSPVYKGELNDLMLPAERTKELILDIPMKTPTARKYLSKVVEEGLLDGEIEIEYTLPVLFLNIIQTPIVVNKHEIERIQTPELPQKLVITNENEFLFRNIIGIIPEKKVFNFTWAPPYELTIELRSMNYIVFKEEGIEGVLIDLKGVLENMDWSDEELSLMMDFLKETTPHLRLLFEGSYVDHFEIILPKNVKVIDVQILQGNPSYFINRARNSILVSIQFYKPTAPSIVDPYGRAELLIIFTR